MTCPVPGCDRLAAGDLCEWHAERERYALAQQDDMHHFQRSGLTWCEWVEAQVAPVAPPVAVVPVDTSRWADADGSPYGLAALAGIVGELSGFTEPGSGRNNALNRAAYRCGQLVAGGELREQVARASLRWCAERMGLRRAEYGPVIDRALRDGGKSPRQAPQTRRAA